MYDELVKEMLNKGKKQSLETIDGIERILKSQYGSIEGNGVLKPDKNLNENYNLLINALGNYKKSIINFWNSQKKKISGLGILETVVSENSKKRKK